MNNFRLICIPALWIILLVNLVASINSCTTTKDVPQEVVPCDYANYVHTDSLNDVRALYGFKLDSMATVGKTRTVQLDSLQSVRLDTLKCVLRVVQPYLPDTQGYHIYLPLGMRNIAVGTKWTDNTKRQQYIWISTFPIDSFLGGID